MGQGVAAMAGLHGGQLFEGVIEHAEDLMGMIHPARLGGAAGSTASPAR